MDIKDFRSGYYFPADDYKFFLPEKINHPWKINDSEILMLLEQATAKLSALNAHSEVLPDADLFIRMHVAKEATTSSRIEGTQTFMDDTVLNKSQVDPELRDDWQEVHNYIQALKSATASLKKLPLSKRLLRETHRVLMRGVRGKHKSPGEFRRSQNWIGGSSPRNAVFVPPQASHVEELMGDLEKFLHNNSIQVPHLIRIAIAHYQFETIHPFLDGNGRIGRLLITLYLVAQEVLRKPCLYLSDFFERNRSLYYEHLTRTRTANELVPWLRFFLNGVIETADKSTATLKAIVALKLFIERKKIPTLGKRAPLARKALHFILQKPILSVNELMDELGVSKPTAHALAKDFVRLKILKEKTGFRRNRIFVFEAYMKLFRE